MFCREWRLFNYETRKVRFACEVGSPEGKDVVSEINLRQFSSATVPKVCTGALFLFLIKSFLSLFLCFFFFWFSPRMCILFLGLPEGLFA